MRVRSLGWEDPLEEGMATHSTILAWRTPWTEEPGGLRSMGSQGAGHDRSHFTRPHVRLGSALMGAGPNLVTSPLLGCGVTGPAVVC